MMLFRKKHNENNSIEDLSHSKDIVQQKTEIEIESLEKEQQTSESSKSSAQRQIGMITDVGRKREIDEDSIMVAELSLGVNSQSHKFRLLVVADGMGGHARGEEASKIALNAISRSVIPRLLDGVPYTKLLDEGIRNANSDILEYVAKNPESHGMGTTAVCAVVIDNEVYLANIGDSRAYIICTDEIRRITKDHSYVQALVDEGSITEEQARTHPKKNIIVKAIGAAPEAESDMMQLTLADDEHLLLCCDGVMAHLSDNDIRKIIIESKDSQDACKRIVDTANKRGGTDNISMVILSSDIDNDNFISNDTSMR